MVVGMTPIKASLGDEYIVVVRHADGGIAYRDSGDDMEALRTKAREERERARKRLGDRKADAMTLTIYRRMP